MKRISKCILVFLLIMMLMPISTFAEEPSNISIQYSKTLTVGEQLGSVNFTVSGTGVCKNGEDNGSEWSTPTQLFCWYKTGSSEMLSVDTVVEEGQSYYPCIYICLEEGYEALDDISVNVNGTIVTASGFGDGIYVNCPAIGPSGIIPIDPIPEDPTPVDPTPVDPTPEDQKKEVKQGAAIKMLDNDNIAVNVYGTPIDFVLYDESAKITAIGGSVTIDDTEHFKIHGEFVIKEGDTLRVNVTSFLQHSWHYEYNGEEIYTPSNAIIVERNSDEHGTFSATVTLISEEGEYYTCKVGYTYPLPQEKPVNLEYEGVLLEFLSGASNWALKVEGLKPDSEKGKKYVAVVPVIELIDIINIYDINVFDDKGNKKTDGEFTIRIPLERGLENYREFSFLYIDDSGEDFKSGDSVKAHVEDGFIVAKLPHLSIYALLGTKETTTAGSNIGLLIGISAAIIAGGTILLILLKKKKQKNKN